MFKICVLGCGGLSTSGHGPSFKKYFEDYKDEELSACCDLDEEQVKHTRKKFGFQRFYTDYNEMLDTEKPDVVSLICPVKFTKDLAISIIKKGYNIILEKPPGLNKEEVYEIIKEAEQHKDVFAESADNIPESILSRYSVAVLNFNPENINIAGDLRLTKYAWFLKENYFDPRGDLCNASGQAILRYVLGDKTQKNL